MFILFHEKNVLHYKAENNSVIQPIMNQASPKD